jgi:hypothetical protein
MLTPEREAEIRENVRLRVRTNWTSVGDLLAEVDALREALSTLRGSAELGDVRLIDAALREIDKGWVTP